MSFLSFVLPPVFGYFVVAALAVTPRTRPLRVALLPVVTLFALRAAVSVDMSSGKPDRKFCNALFVFSMLFIVIRTIDWTLAKDQLVRRLHPPKGSQSTVADALDLATTLRGQGWYWARKVHIPPETRPTDRRGFIFHVIVSAVLHAFMSRVLLSAIRSFSVPGLATLSGASIFDGTLPPYVRFSQGSVIMACATLLVYAAVQTCYDACTAIAVLVFRQDPAEWPPAFDAPWRATSVGDFWGRRWHQFFRRTFLVQGGYPLALILGRPGLVIGTFLSSGVLHHIGMASLNDRVEPWRCTVGFGMLGVGVLVEQVFERCTGRKVAGPIGWVWTMMWQLVWGNLIVDAFARAGVFAHFNFAEGLVPGQDLIRYLVRNVEAALHAA